MELFSIQFFSYRSAKVTSKILDILIMEKKYGA